MSPDELRGRTLEFALAVYGLARPLLRPIDTRHVAYQLIKASTSFAANYRAACLARSRAEWLAKIGVVREEADESLFWLVFTNRIDATPDKRPTVERLAAEAGELARIFTSTLGTGRNNK